MGGFLFPWPLLFVAEMAGEAEKGKKRGKRAEERTEESIKKGTQVNNTDALGYFTPVSYIIIVQILHYIAKTVVQVALFAFASDTIFLFIWFFMLLVLYISVAARLFPLRPKKEGARRRAARRAHLEGRRARKPDWDTSLRCVRYALY